MRIRTVIANYLRGLAMGAADVVPGVSGGTIAFVSGIYEPFIKSLKSFDLHLLKLVLDRDLAAAWNHVNGALLLPVFLGIVSSILTLVGLVSYLLETHTILIWSFFGGLILASAVVLIRQMPSFRLPELGWMLLGVLLIWLITVTPQAQVSVNSFTIVLAGAVAISAMLLPGISGSFVLLILGFYEVTLAAVHNRELDYLILFLIGAGCGFLLFSRIIYWLLKHHHAATLACMIGLLIGSLSMIWPWKSDGAAGVGMNVLPQQFADSGLDPQVGLAVLFAVCGGIIVLLIEWIATRFKSDAEQNL